MLSDWEVQEATGASYKNYYGTTEATEENSLENVFGLHWRSR